LRERRASLVRGERRAHERIRAHARIRYGTHERDNIIDFGA
jgi:hypothetical protein